MRSSYSPEDVVLLLKDITGLVQPQPTEERERLIQSGRHYSEMLPVEYVPSEKYMAVYREALDRYAGQVAEAAGVLADKIMAVRGKDVVLVSLARAGIPIGILTRRYIRLKYRMDVPHYSISIIRGRGIDDNAMKYLLDRYRPEQLLFVDGWIGKGAILGELKKDLGAYPCVSPEIAVLADPAGVTELCGTHEDILIPSSCLNSTVSGLVSRTFLREDIIGPNDFHGAVYYGELKDSDRSYEFIETIEKYFSRNLAEPESCESVKEAEPAKPESCESVKEAEPAKPESRESVEGAGPVKPESRESVKGAGPVKPESCESVKGAEPAKPESRESVKGAGPVKPESREFVKGAEPAKPESRESVKGAEPAKPESRESVKGAEPVKNGIEEVREIAGFFGIEDINFVKPGIGETTRVLLRRVPWKILIDERYRGNPELNHIVRLAEEKDVPLEYYPMVHYKCCGIIKKLADA